MSFLYVSSISFQEYGEHSKDTRLTSHKRVIAAERTLPHATPPILNPNADTPFL